MMGIGSALSWETAELMNSQHPYLAPLSVILCLQSTYNQTLRLSLKRIIGTIIGILLIVIVSGYLHVNGWNLGLLILVGGFISAWLKFDKVVLHQLAITILCVFVFEQNNMLDCTWMIIGCCESTGSNVLLCLVQHLSCQFFRICLGSR